MGYTQIIQQIEVWERTIIHLENKIEEAYKQLDEGVFHAPELVLQIKVWNHEIEMLEESIELAYFKVDKYLYDKAM